MMSSSGLTVDMCRCMHMSMHAQLHNKRHSTNALLRTELTAGHAVASNVGVLNVHVHAASHLTRTGALLPTGVTPVGQSSTPTCLSAMPSHSSTHVHRPPPHTCR
jgi:hypothetical protein